jgi:hypothetical protein
MPERLKMRAISQPLDEGPGSPAGLPADKLSEVETVAQRWLRFAA